MNNELGELIRRKRKAKGLTQAQLAEQLDTTQVAISDWETGKNLPSRLALVSEALDITEDDLRMAMAGLFTDDPVVKALMGTNRVRVDVRNALLTLYRDARLRRDHES